MNYTNDGMKVEAGRRAPYTYLGDWVELSNISAKAKTLYWHLSMHINAKRGDTEVWPSRRMLARALGFDGKKPDSVDRYIKELEALNAIEKRSRTTASGDSDTNVYIVHQTPPKGYEGPVDLADWYDAQYKALRETKADKTAAQGVPLKNGVPLKKRGGYPSKTGPNKKELELKENPPPTPSTSSVTAPRTAGDQKLKEEELRGLENQNPKAAGFVAALPTGNRPPTKRQRLAVTTQVVRLLAGGADPEKLRRELICDLGDAKQWFAVFAYRLAEYDPKRFRPSAYKRPVNKPQKATAASTTPATLEGKAKAVAAIRATLNGKKSKLATCTNTTNQKPARKGGDTHVPTPDAHETLSRT